MIVNTRTEEHWTEDCEVVVENSRSAVFLKHWTEDLQVVLRENSRVD